MAEASLTLAGFAAVFRAFAGDTDPDGYSTIRINVVIEGGLAVAFLCYLPVALAAAGITPDSAWRASNGVAVAWVLPRSIWSGFGILRRGWPLPALFVLAWPSSFAGFIALSLGALGITEPSSAHQVGLIGVVGGVGTTFVAQFRVERTGG